MSGTSPNSALSIREDDIPADMQAQYEEYRGKLVEAAADFDDALMEKYLEG